MAEQSRALDSSSGVVGMWVRIPALAGRSACVLEQNTRACELSAFTRISAFFISQLHVFSCDSAFFTLPDLARIIELRSAQLDHAEIANFAPVS